MGNIEKENKAFLLDYFNAISGVEKTTALLQQYITDQELIEHISFFDQAFPRYEVFADEMTAEGNRVIVRARFKGKHEGEYSGIKPTYRPVEFTFIISYTLQNRKIVSHWLIADQLTLMEQLSVSKANI